MSILSMPLGKARGLRRLAHDNGCFTTVALDQRPPMAQILAAGLGLAPSQVSFGDMLAAKRMLVQTLGAHSSAMLLDPNFALPAALDCLPARTGLMVTLEDHRFRDTPGGRLSHSIANWSVEKIKRAGADGVKLLAWYRPDAAPEVKAHQQAYVRNVGDECRAHDIPFVLELLSYALHPSSSPAQTPDLEVAQGAQRVIDTLCEFARPEYGVDLFKLESPLPGARLPARDGQPAHQAAARWFMEMGRICQEAGVPWVMLSAGVTPAEFLHVMQYAYAAGAHGFLAGRAIWADGLKPYPDLAACREILCTQGLQTLQNLIDLTAEAGHPWAPDYSGLGRIDAEGGFCCAYG
jgi:tagatose 1,6-diphosphate aldolase